MFGFAIIYVLLAQVYCGLGNRTNGTNQSPLNYDPNDFNDLETMENKMEELEAECPAGLTCELYSIGRSHEDRDIYVFKLSSGPGRLAIWVDAAIQGREWLGTTTSMRILEHFLMMYGEDNLVDMLLEQYDWYINPVANPDGYVYTWTTDRYWRKNLRPGSGNCIGVDLNRNFDSQYWGLEASSDDPCDEMFCGPEAGSEPEVQAAMAEMTRIQGQQGIEALLSLHTHGRYWMFSWGHTVNNAGVTCARADDNDELLRVATAAVDAMKDYTGDEWIADTSCELFYGATGSTKDWAKEKLGVRYAYSPELRGPDHIVSPEEIQPAFDEIYVGMVAMLDAINSAKTTGNSV